MPMIGLVPFRQRPRIATIGVIVNGGLVGDALYQLPFVRALRAAFPDAHITWIATDGQTAYARELRPPTTPLIDEILENVQLGRKLRDLFTPRPMSRRFSLLIDTRGRWRTTLLARRVPHDLFLAPAAGFLLSDRRPRLGRKRPEHIIDRLLELVTLAAGECNVPSQPLPLPEQAVRETDSVVPNDETMIGLVPGAGDRRKAWPLDRYIEVAHAQAECGRVPVFLLGPAEHEWHEAIRKAVPAALIPLQELESRLGHFPGVEHTIAIGHRLTLAVTNDCGTAHMLAAADCPLISLFGRTRWRKLAPRVTRLSVLDAATFGEPEIESIPTEAVKDAIETMLAELDDAPQKTQKSQR